MTVTWNIADFSQQFRQQNKKQEMHDNTGREWQDIMEPWIHRNKKKTLDEINWTQGKNETNVIEQDKPINSKEQGTRHISEDKPNKTAKTGHDSFNVLSSERAL